MRKAIAVLMIFTAMTMLASCSVRGESGTGNETEKATTPASESSAASVKGPTVVVLQVGDKYDEKSGQVTNQIDVFSTDTPSIHVNTGIMKLKAGAKISGTLHVVEVKDPAGAVVRDIDVLSADDRAPAEEATMHFEYTKPDNGWPVGDYTVNIAVDGVQIDSVEIEVK